MKVVHSNEQESQGLLPFCEPRTSSTVSSLTLGRVRVHSSLYTAPLPPSVVVVVVVIDATVSSNISFHTQRVGLVSLLMDIEFLCLFFVLSFVNARAHTQK